MANVTINIPDDQVPRCQAAFGRYLELGRNATPAEIKAALIQLIRHTVRHYELQNVVLQDVTPT